VSKDQHDPGHEHDHDHDHGHDHEHDHGHAHGLGHSHGPSEGSAFFIGISLNTLFTIVAVVYGLRAHSIALLSDGLHNLSDVLGLALAWGAAHLARRRPSQRRTYGLRSTTILAALANAVLLLLAVGGVAWEAILRLRAPGPVHGEVVLWVAALGVVTNGLSALLFLKGRKHDANLRGAFLHLLADAAVSLGVVLTAGLMLVTGWAWLDPAMSLVVSGTILVSAWSLLRESLNLALDAVPDHIDPEKVRAYLATLPSVTEVHDLHIWAMSTTETALTAHLVMPSCAAHFLGTVCKELHQRFRIEHATLQVEPMDAPAPCRQAADHVV
jgi:cobalt-zinc-cadmium efflux system protein